MSLPDDVRNQIDTLVQGNPVMLFMKGNKMFPQCGFSATVVGILKELEVDFQTFNVLSDQGLRQGIKDYSDWPTIPQLYVKGEFVGGCDIVREMHASGELAQLLGVTMKAVEPPTITLTKPAAKAFSASAEEGSADVLRIEIAQDFSVDLYFGPAQKNDVKTTSEGVALHMDRATAKRANGLTIDYVDGPDGAGFKIDNPNEPARVRQITVQQTKQWLDDKEDFVLIDVRPEGEQAQARIAGAKSLDQDLRDELEHTDKAKRLVFYCHHGMRSQAAAEQYAAQGFRNALNLQGGIDAWSSLIDSSVPRY